MSIASWPESERPREKLLSHGAATLNDSELLAIFLRTGIKGVNAVELARRLLQDFGSLSALLAAPLPAFKAKQGLGEAKYAQLMACTELARRALSEQLKLGDALSSPQQVRDYLRLSIGRREVETFVVIFLSAQNRLIEVEEVFKGTLTETRVYPREVLRRALRHNAAALIIAHNHPSGVSEPSSADRVLTDTLKRALDLVDIRLLDHFVVTGGHAESFAERGWL